MNRKIRLHKDQKGFTIIELMISTVVFSAIMLICLQGMVQVSRAYYKGLTQSRSQEAARLLLDEISSTIQLSGSAVTFTNPVNTGPTIAVGSMDDGVGVLCAGNVKYTYVLDRKVVDGTTNDSLKETRNAIIAEEESCSDTPIPGDLSADATNPTRSLLGENMRLTKFNVTRVQPNASITDEIKSGAQLWQIELSIAYGDQDLLATDNEDDPYSGTYIDDFGNTNTRVLCKPGTGAEFCSIVEMSTIIMRRIA